MPRPSLQVLTRAYFVLAALVFGGSALTAIVGAVNTIVSGCRVVLSQSDFVEPPATGPIPTDLPACQQYVGLWSIFLAAVAAAVLFTAARRFGRADPWSRAFASMGAVVGIAAGGMPMLGIWWLSDFYNHAPPDAMGLLSGAVPLVIGLGAAWVTWRVHVHRLGPAHSLPA